MVDASTAFVALNLLAIGTPARTVAGVCATSESSIQRIQRHAAQHSGAARVPHKGEGKRHDLRWHFGGALGQSNLARLDRLVGSMDASSTLDEIYAAYVATCRLPVPKPSTVAEALRKLEYTTKRLSAYAPDRNDLRCRAWHQRVASLYRRDQFVCIDEVGVNEKSANRNRGRSKRGMPAVTHLNVLAGGSKKSALGVFTEEGFIDVHVVDGAFATASEVTCDAPPAPEFADEWEAGLEHIDPSEIDMRTAVHALRHALQRPEADVTIGSAHHLRPSAATLAKRRDKHTAQPPGRFAAGTYEELAAAREGGQLDGMHATVSALQQQLADAEARVGTKGPPSDQCMSSLVNMLTAMQGVGPPGMGGSGAAPTQPSAA